MFQLQIPKPCHEEWANMLPTKAGAFCNTCAKEVVDFTNMTDAEVQNFFLHKTHGVCGRFNGEQIRRVKIELPHYIFYRKIADWKKYLAIVLLAFSSMLFGCDVNAYQPTTGLILTEPPMKVIPHDSLCNVTMGTPAFTKPDSSQIIKSNKVMVGELVVPPIIKDSAAGIDAAEIFNGNVEIISVDTIPKTIKAPVLDSSNQLKTTPVIDTLITE